MADFPCTRLHPQGRWPEGPPSAAHVSLCLTFGTLKLHSSPLKPSKSGPQNLKNTYFWDPETSFFASETFKIWSPNPQNRSLLGPFSGPDFERFTGEIWSFEVPKRAQNDTKMSQLLWYRADRQTDRRTQTD